MGRPAEDSLLAHVLRHTLAGFRPRDLRASLPSLAFAALFAALAAGVLGRHPWTLRTAEALALWPAFEVAGILFQHYLVWIFTPGDRTPRYQRVLSLPTVLFCTLGLGGLWLFWWSLKVLWLFLLVKAAALWLEPPDDDAQLAGCLRSLVSFALMAGLGLLYLEWVPGAGRGGAGADPRWSLALGAVYYTLSGAAECLYRPFVAIPPYRRGVRLEAGRGPGPGNTA